MSKSKRWREEDAAQKKAWGRGKTRGRDLPTESSLTRSDIVKIVEQTIQQLPPNIPNDITVKRIRVDETFDWGALDGFQPDQQIMIMPTAPTEGQVYVATIDPVSGEQVVVAEDAATIAVTTDGLAPVSSPDPTVTGGTGILSVTWAQASNADPVQYEVHVSTSTGFTPSGATLVFVTPALHAIITQEADGTPLELDTPYYVKIIAYDEDGTAPASSQDSDSITRLSTDHLETDGGTPVWGSALTYRPGPGWLKAQWLLPSGTEDPLFYNVFIDTTPGFSINFSTNYVGMTFGNDMVIGALKDASILASDTDYYIKVQAVSDLSGNAATSAELGPVSPEILDGEITTISNLDAGNITAGFIDAARIDAGTIAADHLNANDALFETLNTLLVETNTMIAGDPDGLHVVVGGDGVFLLDGGEEIVSLPTNGDPAVFRGTIIADSLTVIQGATFQGSANVMDDGSTLTLVDTQADPTVPATISAGREYQLSSGGASTIFESQGIFVDDSNDVFYRQIMRSGGSNEVYVEKWTRSTMEYVGRYNLTSQLNTSRGVSHDYACGGVVAIGSNVYNLIIDITPATYVMWLIEHAASNLNTITDTDNVGTLTNESEVACLGTDGTYGLVARWFAVNEEIEIEVYNACNWLSQIVLFGTPDPPLDDNFCYITGITYDSGNDYYWVAFKQSFGAASGMKDFVSAYDAGTGDYIPDQDWYLDTFGKNTLIGLCENGSDTAYGFYYVREETATNPRLYWTAPLNWTTETDYYHFSYRWHDGTPGSYQTAAAPISSLSLTGYRRFHVNMTTPSPGALKRYPLVVRKSTVPTADELRDQGRSSPYVDHTAETFLRFRSYNGSGTLNSPDANTFGAGNSSIIATGSNVTAPWKLEGDGGMDLTLATATQRDAAFPSPDTGQIIIRNEDMGPEIYDGDAWRGIMVPGAKNFRKSAYAFTDCGQLPTMSTNTPANDGWLAGFVGTGSTLVDTAATSHADVWTLRMGTTASTSFSNITKWRDYPYTAASKITWAAQIRIPNASNATDRYDFYFGLMDGTDPRAITDGVFIRYSDSKATPSGTASTFDLVHCVGGGRNADALDDNGGAITVSTGTWYIIEVEHIPGTGTSVWITAAGGARTKKVTNYATSIPTASKNSMQFRLGLKRAAGSSNNRDIDVDWIYSHIEYATDRST